MYIDRDIYLIFLFSLIVQYTLLSIFRFSSGLGDIMIDDILHQYHHQQQRQDITTPSTPSLSSSSSPSLSTKISILWSSNQWKNNNNNSSTTHIIINNHPKGRQMISMLRRSRLVES
jgi:hypothetical protein